VLAPRVAVPPLLFGLTSGVLTGLLQSYAIRRTKTTLRLAETAMEVRRALMQDRMGMAAIAMQWLFAIGLFTLSLLRSRDNFVFAFVTGYAAFLAARESVALPAVRELHREE
jgi:hypothetical protein